MCLAANVNPKTMFFCLNVNPFPAPGVREKHVFGRQPQRARPAREGRQATPETPPSTRLISTYVGSRAEGCAVAATSKAVVASPPSKVGQPRGSRLSRPRPPIGLGAREPPPRLRGAYGCLKPSTRCSAGASEADRGGMASASRPSSCCATC